MAVRKKIGLITIYPENDYQQKVMSSVFAQCEKYNYDVVVITPMVQVANFFKDYLNGELNIYNLINFDYLDGVIVTPIPMTEDRITTVIDSLLEKFKKECKKPVVSIDLPFGDYHTVYTDDSVAFEEITNHLIEKHNCSNISVLTGMKNYAIAENRVEGVRRSMEKHGLKLDSKKIVYGDFWYTSGEALGEKIVSGKFNPGDAVICASDHMAIGLTNYLRDNGINVPQDLIVTGYEAIREAILNNPPITSYYADEDRTAALAVNYLHSQLEPKKKELVVEHAGTKNLCIGATCGCSEDLTYTRDRIVENEYLLNKNTTEHRRGVNPETDIGILLESYMSEILTATPTPEICLNKIYELIYLLKPYGHFYLCLNEDWLNTDNDRTKGYADVMNLVIYSDMEKKLHGYSNHVFFGEGRTKAFKLSEMLPALKSGEFEKPQVFYFVPVHFNNIALGYAVLQNDLSQKNKIGAFYRNYIRNINNALEMARAKNRIENMSEHDLLTGLLNRRGMEKHLEKMIAEAKPGSKYLAIVVDMDGLKILNDSYGHSAGDTGLIAISEAMKAITEPGEICVRAGGDEFYLIGIGKYTKKSAMQKIDKFNKVLDFLNERKNTVMPVGASIGFSVEGFASTKSIDKVIEIADVNMYLDKRTKKIKR